jgi:DNA-binding SARP family transcriptional activator
MATDLLSILILGSPNITWRDKPYHIPRRQARAMLYHLAEVIKPVPRQQLCFLFWPDLPNTKARRNLNRLLSYLHQTLPHREMLIISDETIQLNPDLVQSDADQFQLLSEQRYTASTQQAVNLYRGDFLEGFYLPKSLEYDLWLTTERHRLEREYLALLANLVDTLMDNGDYRQAIPFAQNYLRIDNLAEELHRRVIICHFAMGNRAAAKAQFEQMTLTLEKELGVLPLPETVFSYESSLSGQISPLRTAPTPKNWSILPSINLPMVGRGDAWWELSVGYQKHRQGGVLFIAGEAGIGKSRILKEFATHSHRYVINGNAYPSTQSYQPIIQALQVALPHKWLWQDIPPVWVAEISLILPDLSVYFPDMPVRINLDPQQAQARMLEALTKTFLGLASKALPMVFCLDDLHWADQMTLEWLKYLAPRLPHSNLCILATYRTEKSDQLLDLQRILARHDLFSEVILTGLEQSAVAQMIKASGTDQLIPAGWVPELRQLTDGNPFFILEILSELLAQGRVVDPAALPVSRNINTLIEARLSRLPMVTRQVLEACAVLSHRLEFELIESTSGRQEFELIEALEELTRQNLLKEVGRAYVFRHELIRQAVYQKLSPRRCQLLHKRAGAAFELLNKKTSQDEFARIAYHYDRAAMLDLAVEYYFAAARSAQAIYAYQAAVSYLQRGIELLPDSGHTDAFAAQLHELLGDCLANLGGFSPARDNYNIALCSLRQGNPQSTAALLRKCAAAFGGEFAYDQALPLLDQALELLETHPGEATLAWQHTWLDVQLERMFLYYQKAQPERIDEISNQIHPLIEQVGTPSHKIRFLTGLNYSTVRKNRYQVSREIVESERRALAVAENVGDVILICERKFNTGVLSLLFGDLDSAIADLSSGLELARKSGLYPLELQCLVYLMAAHRRLGHLWEVKSLLPACLEVARLVGQPNYTGAALAHQAWLEFRLGETTAAKETALQALDIWTTTRTYPFQWMVLWLLLALAQAQGDDALVLQATAALVHPIQQAAPQELEDLLQFALHSAEHPDKARQAIEQALLIARLHGFL